MGRPTPLLVETNRSSAQGLPPSAPACAPSDASRTRSSVACACMQERGWDTRATHRRDAWGGPLRWGAIGCRAPAILHLEGSGVGADGSLVPFAQLFLACCKLASHARRNLRAGLVGAPTAPPAGPILGRIGGVAGPLLHASRSAMQDPARGRVGGVRRSEVGTRACTALVVTPPRGDPFAPDHGWGGRLRRGGAWRR